MVLLWSLVGVLRIDPDQATKMVYSSKGALKSQLAFFFFFKPNHAYCVAKTGYQTDKVGP